MNLVTIHVRDSGPGIPAEHQKDIFNTFTQVDRQAGPGSQGTGLGLAISQQLMKLHEGSISLESGIGKGSTFSIEFPTYSEPNHIRAFVHQGMQWSSARGEPLSLILFSSGTWKTSRIGS